MEKKLTSLLFALMAIPVGTKEGWTELSFKKLTPNTVTVENNALKVSVDKSASPLVYKLDSIKKVKSIEAEVSFDGDVNETKHKWNEDSVFRLGLVVEGEKKLTGVRKYLAADWVLKLFSLAPEESGLDKIYFYNIGKAPAELNQQRIHPKSELLSEEIVAIRKDESTMKIKKQFSLAVPTMALWISIDGDDTKSKFSTTIKKITLETE
jgi:hypothetical protein